LIIRKQVPFNLQALQLEYSTQLRIASLLNIRFPFKISFI